MTLKIILRSNSYSISFGSFAKIVRVSSIINYTYAQVISLKQRLIPLLLNNRANITIIRWLTRQIIEAYISTIFLLLSLYTQITKRNFSYGVIIPVLLTLFISFKLKIYQFPISLKLLEISLKTLLAKSLLISFLRKTLNNSLKIVIIPLIRSSIEIYLSLAFFSVRKLSIIFGFILFIKNIIKI